MRKTYLAIATVLLAAICPASAQKGDLQRAGTSLSGSQGENKRVEALVFKPIPGDPKNRMAEFTTPAGVRIRAFTDGPDSIRFTPVDQTQMPGDIYLHCPRAVEKLSGEVGASVDLFKTALGGLATGRGHFVGGKVTNCKITTTIVIGEDGKTTTTMKITCDIA